MLSSVEDGNTSDECHGNQHNMHDTAVGQLPVQL